jgi:FMN phosphatase YigB (HAD superfamily)
MIIGFDWDGTLVESWTATPLPGARERLAELPPGTKTFIATNQAGPVFRAMRWGDPAWRDAKYPTCGDVAQRIIAGLAALDWRPDYLFVAAHPGQEPTYEWHWAALEVVTPLYDLLGHVCWCSVSALVDDRKPRAGMLRSAALECDCVPSEMLYIGDMDTDHQAAVAAGCRYLDAAVWRERGLS